MCVCVATYVCVCLRGGVIGCISNPEHVLGKNCSTEPHPSSCFALSLGLTVYFRLAFYVRILGWYELIVLLPLPQDHRPVLRHLGKAVVFSSVSTMAFIELAVPLTSGRIL